MVKECLTVSHLKPRCTTLDATFSLERQGTSTLLAAALVFVESAPAVAALIPLDAGLAVV